MPENLEMLTRERQRPIAVSLLGDFIEESRARPKDFSNMAVHGISNTRGFVASEDLFSVSRASLDQSNYKVVSPNSFAYNPSRINVGSIALSSNQQDVLVSPMYTVFRTTKKLVPEYLAHFLRSSHFKAYMLSNIEVGARFRFTFDALANTPIQVPSIEVQLEIVSILDTFAELEAKLEAELDSRVRQYEHYREILFALSGQNVEWVQLGDVATCYAGATPSTTISHFWENGTIPWMSSGEVNKRSVSSTDKLITQDAFDSCSTKMVPAGSVVVALAGQGKTRGMVARILAPLCTNQSLAALVLNEQKITQNFLYFFLETQYQTLRSISSGDGTRGGLNLQMIREFKVPLPSIELQLEIANQLELFDSLANDLSSGLPAEIAARRKQYEYYRNQLLTFEEPVA